MFSMQLLALITLRVIRVVFYKIVDECSTTCLGHDVTQCINIPHVFYSSCIKNMQSGVSPEKNRMPPGVVTCTSDDPSSS